MDKLLCFQGPGTMFNTKSRLGCVSVSLRFTSYSILQGSKSALPSLAGNRRLHFDCCTAAFWSNKAIQHRSAMYGRLSFSILQSFLRSSRYESNLCDSIRSLLTEKIAPKQKFTSLRLFSKTRKPLEFKKYSTRFVLSESPFYCL